MKLWSLLSMIVRSVSCLCCKIIWKISILTLINQVMGKFFVLSKRSWCIFWALVESKQNLRVSSWNSSVELFSSFWMCVGSCANSGLVVVACLVFVGERGLVARLASFSSSFVDLPLVFISLWLLLSPLGDERIAFFFFFFFCYCCVLLLFSWKEIKKKKRVTLRSIVDPLLRMARYRIFGSPVDTEIYKDYKDVVEEPIDLGTISERIDDNYYKTVG